MEGRAPNTSELVAASTRFKHATAAARFSYRIKMPSSTRATPATDFELRYAVHFRAISVSSRPRYLFYLFVEREVTRSTAALFFHSIATHQFGTVMERTHRRVLIHSLEHSQSLWNSLSLLRCY